MSAAKGLASPWRLLVDSLKAVWSNKGFFFVAVSVVALPLALLSFGQPSEEQELNNYYAPASFMMTLAIFWAATRITYNKEVSLKEAYYKGTSSAVKFFLVSAVVALSLLPFLLGAGIFSVSLLPGSGASMIERIIYGLIWLLFSLASLFLFSRVVFGLHEVVMTDASPVQGLKNSWKRTRRHSLSVMGRLLVLGLIAGLFMLLSALLATGISLVFPEGALVISSYFVTLLVLPLSYLYLSKLHRQLHEH